MLTVTEKAAALIGDTLAANRQRDADVFRLSRVGSDLGLDMDEEREGDQVVSHEGGNVLVVDSGLAGELAGITIDTVETPDGAQLTLLFPEEQPA